MFCSVPGYLQHVEIDTAHFKGNFPESCELHALYSEDDVDWTAGRGEDERWQLVLPRTKLGPHRQHYFQLVNVEGNKFTHVRVTIHPDGGIKRVRVYGRRGDIGQFNSASGQETLAVNSSSDALMNSPSSRTSKSTLKVLPVLPLTPEAFATFGQVVQAYGDHTAAPKGTKITPANAGTANKFHKLALLASSYPLESGATSGLSVYRCQPLKEISTDGITELTTLERHSFTNQAFVPMGSGPGEGLEDPAQSYLVVVAHNGKDDRPDLSTLRAFVASTAQGIVYNMGIWRELEFIL
jgi:allantoicase